MGRPSPVPWMSFVACESTRENRSKIVSSASGGIPRPSSRTSKRTSLPSARVVTMIRPPVGEYFTALFRRLDALRLLDRLTLPPEGLDGRERGGDLVREQREHPCVVFGVCDRRFVRPDAERSESAAAAHQGHREAGVEARFLADLRATLPGL